MAVIASASAVRPSTLQTNSYEPNDPSRKIAARVQAVNEILGGSVRHWSEPVGVTFLLYQFRQGGMGDPSVERRHREASRKSIMFQWLKKSVLNFGFWSDPVLRYSTLDLS